MAKIIEKKKLNETVWSYLFDAPQIAKKRKAGQFIILRVTQDGERIPLTIANANPEKGWIEIIFQVVGLSTKMLAELNVGDEVVDLVGPLGKATHIENFGKCICIGGGVGVAPLYPIVESLNAAGNNITTIIGARNQSLLILEKEIAALSDRSFVATDDGSYGQKGFVSDVLKQLLNDGEHFDYAVVIGPPMMMKATSAIALDAGITTFVSLNPVMIDGTGMCGGCRVNIDGKAYFACVDGPEFNAKGIDWDVLNNRLANYGRKSEPSTSKHACKLEEKLQTIGE
ncbi:MAG: sulfide/dihydroorotate dehydrogenase-like FAD/NAD-binding protein [Gammaproteobacteria bacterium]|nr:sulfide/dihydroorotate dehydrogenase-like FAD/NAD-binding protein [Gammaproteobacteria bacterium]